LKPKALLQILITPPGFFSPQVSLEAAHWYPVGGQPVILLSPLPTTQECPCVLTAELLQDLGASSTVPGIYPPFLGETRQLLRPGDELGPGQMFQMGCSNW
jgi:hypothetical protein